MRTVAEVMRAPALTVPPTTSLQEASARMLDARLHAAVLVEDERVCGIVTTDELSAALARGCDPASTPVADVAQPDPPLVQADEPLAEAHLRMRTAGHMLAPVVTDDGKPVGLLEDH